MAENLSTSILENPYQSTKVLKNKHENKNLQMTKNISGAHKDLLLTNTAKNLHGILGIHLRS